jgi:regulator of protease activity HflC (stomatin/prohibitin superfamily)
MKLRIDVALHERAIVHRNKRPVRYLRPGRHWMPLGLVPYALRIEVLRIDTKMLRAELTAEQLALVPAEDLMVLTVAPHERALVVRKGRPALWLAEGEHQIWMTERVVRQLRDGSREERPAVEVVVYDTSAVEAEPLRDRVKALVPDADYTERMVPQGAVAIRYVDGRLDAVLPAGRHAAWTTRRNVTFAVIDRRERVLQVTGQEVMTRDRMTLRLNLSAVYRVSDAERLATVASEADEIVYLAMQMAAREAVVTRTLDELLAERHEMGEAIGERLAARARTVGLELVSFGLKDVVLPGDIKALLNRVIAARKEAEANVILRREETAATRSQAQTAKMLAENPILVRLKELEAYKELAASVGQVKLVLGEDAVPSLKIQT